MSQFTIFPAIDIRGGKCVRLLQGDYTRETVYGDSPLAMAWHFSEQGGTWIHAVDLDGAKQGEPVNAVAIHEMKQQLPVRVQTGGGIRSEEAINRYLEAGIDRVVLGSSAIANPDFVKAMLARYKGQIAIGIDVRDGYVAVNGWTTTSEVRAEDLARELATYGAETFIFTDISRDGALTGPNVEAIANFAHATGTNVIASGGVRSLADVKTLASCKEISGAIIGRALYTGTLTLKAALAEGVD